MGMPFREESPCAPVSGLSAVLYGAIMFIWHQIHAENVHTGFRYTPGSIYEAISNSSEEWKEYAKLKLRGYCCKLEPLKSAVWMIPVLEKQKASGRKRERSTAFQQNAVLFCLRGGFEPPTSVQ